MRERKSFVEELADSLTRRDVLEIELKNTIVSAIITARIGRSMNQKQFAKFMGVSQAMISKWESGEYNFTLEAIARICEKLELVPSLELIRESDYLAIKENDLSKWETITYNEEPLSEEYDIPAVA